MQDDRRMTWTPPPRPEWVQRVNEEGECMNLRGVVPLDEQSLLNSAMQATGLSDFGVDDWREPFRVLVKSMDEDADLNLMGRIRTRSEILQALEARLQVEETYKRHPEIENEEIKQPLIIIGQGRSGTSFLQHVLAEDPDHDTLHTWECIYPAPPPEKGPGKNDERIARAHKAIDQWNRVTPTLASMHEFAGYIPMECCQLVGLSFRSISWFASLGQCMSYMSYMTTQSMEPALRYHKRVLKLLQWKNPRKRWVLKDPIIYRNHTKDALKVFPDACFIWPHRDPIKAMASTISLIGTIQWGRSDHPFKDGSFDAAVDPDYAASELNAFIDQLEAGTPPANQFFSLTYQDLVSNTVATIDKMYAHFGIPFTPQARAAMEKYLHDNPRTARPPHKVQSASDETIARERRAFKRYQDYFHVPSE